MSNILKSILVFLTLLILSASQVYAAPSAKLTAQVLDETERPINGADVLVGYAVGKQGDVGINDTKVRGKTDKDGNFTATGDTILPHVTIHAEHDGYYRSVKWAKFSSRSLLNRWQPWNPTVEVVLKKKRNPVGMVARDTGGLKVPVFDKPVGFDLEKGDWVAPYGNGTIGDFIIEFNSDVKAYTNYSCGFRLSFSNERDGIQEYVFDTENESYYEWPFEAPKQGYLNSLSKNKSFTPQKGFDTNIDEKINYIFRVRTRMDDKGNIIEAKYGKILRDFEIGPNGDLVFLYYYNPDGTNNLEFDPNRNLAKWESRRDEQKHALKQP